MIPAFPMDGGRVLRALLALKLPYRRATGIAVNVGRLFAVAFGVFGIMTGNFSLALVAMFIFFGAGAEMTRTSRSARACAGLTVSEVVDNQAPVFPASLPAFTAFERSRALAVCRRGRGRRGRPVPAAWSPAAGCRRGGRRGCGAPSTAFVEMARPVQVECDALAGCGPRADGRGPHAGGSRLLRQLLRRAARFRNHQPGHRHARRSGWSGQRGAAPSRLSEA